MNYQEGDKVLVKSLDWYNKNKDSNGNIDINHDFTFYADRSKYCGKVLTIVEVFDNCYAVKEDNNEYYWSDEMIERLVERNGKTYPYKIGDRVILKGNNRCATITDLKYNSFGNLSYYIKIDNDKDISTDCPTELLLPYDKPVEEETPKFEIDNKDCPDNTPKNNDDVYSISKCKTIGQGTYAIKIAAGYKFDSIDENGNIIVRSIKPTYPTTFLGCCDVLEIEDTISRGVKGYKSNLLDTFQKLIICRDAYWKIAGEEMGLGKPWEPDWNNTREYKYYISTEWNEIQTNYNHTTNKVLAFPTEKMRDDFKKNFDPDIENCKEFL